ncbi:MAG: NAD(P)(+) transhydrogenase (Re/Si-specific) subunit beta [Saprospiraceae bacterium]|nr:NAD(P)(+) transhydrogenase (Re/Si-specific) subunit beta [Saprospiraceae bacterium]
MLKALLDIGFLIASVGLIFGLKRQSDPATARSGNMLAAYSMIAGIIMALVYPLDVEGSLDPVGFGYILVSLAIGTFIGIRSANKVEMTGMPQLVSLFNGLGGLSAVLVGYVELLNLNKDAESYYSQAGSTIFALVVGAIAFSGSLLAYLKLDGKLKDSQVAVKGHQYINYALLAITLVMIAVVVMSGANNVMVSILLVISLIYGWSFVAPIGGADMPVVISLLNSFTGLTAAAAGLIYGNQFMLLGGILVGASGTILTVLMCNAMNRSLWNVIAGNFAGSGSSAAAGGPQGSVREASAADTGVMMYYAQKVVIVPGYGLAVAQAQQYVKQIYQILSDNDVKVVFGIHPVAGRMPGHMNVLLAEVDIPYDALLDLEEANEELATSDVALIIGANDVVNPSAVEDQGSSIYGMPVLEVWKSKNVVVMKRSMASGYAGIENPLFFKPNTQMLFGDAKKTLADLVSELKNL